MNARQASEEARLCRRCGARMHLQGVLAVKGKESGWVWLCPKCGRRRVVK